MNMQRLTVLVMAGALLVFFSGCGDMKRSGNKTIPYGNVLIGTSKTLPASWTNNSKNKNVEVLGCSTYDNDASDFVVDPKSYDNADKDLAPNETFTIDIVFAPKRVGDHKTKVRPLSTAGKGDKYALTGTGVYLYEGDGLGCSGGNSSKKAAMDFGRIVVKQTSTETKTVELTNNTTNTIRILARWGKKEQVFSISKPSFPVELKAGESVTVHISFTPPREDTFEDGLYFEVDGGTGKGGVSVKGEGVTE